MKEITSRRRGRPVLLENELDKKVQNFLLAVRNRGGKVTYSIAIATAKALIERSSDSSLSLIKPSTNWAQSLFRRMGFKKRATTTGKVSIPEGAKKESELVFLHDIVGKIEKYEIPSSLVINLNQTQSKYIQCSRYTMEKAGAKSVTIVGASDKRAITATFSITLDGSFLPMQLIYGGKTKKSLPPVEFPEGFSLSVNPTHYSNTEESIKIIKEIIVPYVKKERENRNVPLNFPAVLIMDVFRGQMTDSVLGLLESENILVVRVPNNMTHLFQPLDLTVNSWAKNYMRERFSEWYASKISENLDKGTELEDIDIKTPLSVMKPIHAKWLIDLYNELTSANGQDIIISGWKAAGIYDAVKIGSKELPQLDPFAEIDPSESTMLNVDFDVDRETLPLANHPNVNSRYDSSDESEYEMQIDDRNAFDAFE